MHHGLSELIKDNLKQNQMIFMQPNNNILMA
jgi:hypothetical protein